MDININQATLRKSTYKDYFFWENKIMKEHALWEGYFDNKEITKDSKIIYTGILDSKKNILKCGWAVYPSIYSLLGFLQHVFLPTAFFSWFDRESEGFFIPVSTFDIVVDEVKRVSTSDIDIDSLNSMKESHNYINKLWYCDHDSLNLELKSFCESFNNTWDSDPNQKLFINIFDSPSDTFEFIKESIGWEDFEEFIEEEISMSLDTLKFTCENVITEPLLNKKFIDILNTNMPILF